VTAIHCSWRHPFAEQVREEGRVEESAKTALSILERRNIPVPDAVRERVPACTDREQLEVWAQRAVHAANAEDLFAEGDGESVRGRPVPAGGVSAAPPVARP
jgi:hypothetical protein